MNAHRATMLTHFGPLFLTALGGWTAFNAVNSGTLALVPGVIVAALLAYGGSLLALRYRAVDRRMTAPPAPAARGTGTTPSGEPRYEMDIAAGD